MKGKWRLKGKRDREGEGEGEVKGHTMESSGAISIRIKVDRRLTEQQPHDRLMPIHRCAIQRRLLARIGLIDNIWITNQITHK